jgi:hypothetical protein
MRTHKPAGVGFSVRFWMIKVSPFGDEFEAQGLSKN